MDKKTIGEFEELVLLAILQLRDGAYGVPIWQKLEDAGRKVSIGSLYVTLDRLEDKGFVSSRLGEATPERGGRAKRYFKIEGAGMQVLEDVQQVRSKMQYGLGFPLGEMA